MSRGRSIPKVNMWAVVTVSLVGTNSVRKHTVRSTKTAALQAYADMYPDEVYRLQDGSAYPHRVEVTAK